MVQESLKFLSSVLLYLNFGAGYPLERAFDRRLRRQQASGALEARFFLSDFSFLSSSSSFINGARLAFRL
jgi:hypothetical protein